MKATDAVIDSSSPGEEPIRAGLFGIERLEQHAESLAAAHRTTEEPPGGRDLLPGVRENGGQHTHAAIRYMVEPYAVAADIYSEPPHVGRGGWTWYTGAAGWIHRAGLEWPHPLPNYGREPEGSKPRGVPVSLDGTLPPGDALIPLSDDGREHQLEVVLGGAPRKADSSMTFPA